MALTPQTLQRLGDFKVRARAVMEGVLSGLHKSPHQGQSVEFAEHHEYAPGDELRHVDWKAVARFDRYYVKRFEHETNLRAVMLVDASGSMGYGSRGQSKLELARTLAGALSWLLVRQQDAAGLTALEGERLVEVPPRAAAGHVHVLLDALERLQPQGALSLRLATDRLAESLPRRSLVAVFSDFFDADEGALAHLLTLKSRRHDVALFHLLDPDELEFPFEDPTRFESLEDARFLEANPREIRESYLEELGAFLARTKAQAVAAGCDYQVVRTDEAPDDVLLRFLAARQAR